MKKEKNRSMIYIAAFIALIMVLSVIGFLWGGGEGESYRYGEHSFRYEAGKWQTRINGKSLSFSYLPDEVAVISVPENARSLISGARMVYLSYSPESYAEELALAQFNLGRNLETSMRFVVNALTGENEDNIPVIACENATIPVPVILIKKSADDSIILNNSCIILEGNPQMLADRLVYSAYGVMG